MGRESSSAAQGTRHDVGAERERPGSGNKTPRAEDEDDDTPRSSLEALSLAFRYSYSLFFV